MKTRIVLSIISVLLAAPWVQAQKSVQEILMSQHWYEEPVPDAESRLANRDSRVGYDFNKGFPCQQGYSDLFGVSCSFWLLLVLCLISCEISNRPKAGSMAHLIRHMTLKKKNARAEKVRAEVEEYFK